MKKKLALLVISAAMAGMALTGCGDKDSSQTVESSATETSATNATNTTIDNSALDTEGSLLDLNCAEYVTLGDYLGVEVTADEIVISDEEVQSSIDDYMNYYLKDEELIEEGSVASGDTIRIDFTGYLDGEAFDGGHGEDYDLTIGSGTFIPGFEDALIGANIGETVMIDVTFPEDYGSADLAGQPAQFEVVLHAIVKTSIPELTEENVGELAEVMGIEASDVASLKQAVRDQLYASAKESSDEEIGLKVQEAVYQNMTVLQTPEFLQNRLYIRMDENYNYYGYMYNQYYGYTDIYDGATFLNAMQGIPVEEYSDYLMGEAGKYADMYAGFQQIADAEGISVTEEDAMNEINQVYAEYGYESVDDFLQYVTVDAFRDDLMFQTVLEYLVEKANVSYTVAQ